MSLIIYFYKMKKITDILKDLVSLSYPEEAWRLESMEMMEVFVNPLVFSILILKIK